LKSQLYKKLGVGAKGHDAHQSIAPLKETFGQVEAYKAGGAGYQYFHE
jgi:hypothetical protein